MQGSKIRLSPAEAALFADAGIILTKNSVLQKTVGLLTRVQEVFITEAPASIKATSPYPKISKGENHLGLPYIILDYPRIAKGNDLFFIRSMFWWGNFYSSTLQLAGSFKQKNVTRLEKAYERLAEKEYFAGINQDPWVHHFKKDNYQAVSGLSKKAFSLVLEESPHIKIAARWPLQEWDGAEEKLLESWMFFMSLIEND